MKKNVWAKMLGLALVLVCVMGLAACGDKAGSSGAAGSYKLQSFDVDGIAVGLEDLDTEGALDELNIILELKPDGNFTLDMSAIDESQSMEGTWKENGSNIDLTVYGSTVTAPLADGVITLETEGVTMIFKK